MQIQFLRRMLGKCIHSFEVDLCFYSARTYLHELQCKHLPNNKFLDLHWKSLVTWTNSLLQLPPRIIWYATAYYEVFLRVVDDISLYPLTMKDFKRKHVGILKWKKVPFTTSTAGTLFMTCYCSQIKGIHFLKYSTNLKKKKLVSSDLVHIKDNYISCVVCPKGSTSKKKKKKNM